MVDPGDLIIDPLTFTLGSGDEEFRGSALATLEALTFIKAELPGVRTILGVSNVSFGLNPASRHVLNALMLFHGVKHGLDMAIFNASKVIPVAKIDPDDRQIVEDLIFDRRRDGYDPLKALMARFSDRKAAVAADHRADLPILERLHRGILDGEKQAILADVDEALWDHDPLRLINEVLLGAMKVVGERFGAGEMQLPYLGSVGLDSVSIMGIHSKIYGLGSKIRVNMETGLREDYMSLLNEIGLHSSKYTKWKITILTTKLGLKPNLRREEEDAPVVQAAEPAAPRPRGLRQPRSRFPILYPWLRGQYWNQLQLLPSEASIPPSPDSPESQMHWCSQER